MTTTKTHIYFMLVSSSQEIDGRLCPTSWFSEHFTSIKDAKNWHKSNVKNRNKKDGYDEKYHNLPCIIEKYTEIRELIFN